MRSPHIVVTIVLSLMGFFSVREADSAQDTIIGKVVAKWEVRESTMPGLVCDGCESTLFSLIHQAGKMVYSQQGIDASDGSLLYTQEGTLPECPAQNPSERRFALPPYFVGQEKCTKNAPGQVNQRYPRYFTLSAGGVVKYFSKDGNQFDTAVTFIDPDAMSIGIKADDLVGECGVLDRVFVYEEQLRRTTSEVGWTGGCTGGLATGEGIWQWRDERYEGEVRNGKRHGQGILTWGDGARYEGEFREGKRHGQGAFTWGDGSSYEGEFWESERWNGVFTFADGSSYEVRNGKPQ